MTGLEGPPPQRECLLQAGEDGRDDRSMPRLDDLQFHRRAVLDLDVLDVHMSGLERAGVLEPARISRIGALLVEVLGVGADVRDAPANARVAPDHDAGRAW